jgi:prepilin-type N-terminal cleavage/methylation domain-containing protein
MKYTKLKDSGGVTLLEVLVAMIILSVSLLLLLNMTMVALDSNDWANKTTSSTQALQEKLEQLRASHNPQGGSDTANGVERVWTVSPLGNNLLQVDVTATWQDIRGQWVADTMTAYIKE